MRSRRGWGGHAGLYARDKKRGESCALRKRCLGWRQLQPPHRTAGQGAEGSDAPETPRDVPVALTELCPLISPLQHKVPQTQPGRFSGRLSAAGGSGRAAAGCSLCFTRVTPQRSQSRRLCPLPGDAARSAGAALLVLRYRSRVRWFLSPDGDGVPVLAPCERSVRSEPADCTPALIFLPRESVCPQLLRGTGLEQQSRAAAGSLAAAVDDMTRVA